MKSCLDGGTFSLELHAKQSILRQVNHNVGCEMSVFTCQFDPDRVRDCPPTDALQADATIYRHVKKFPASEDDFASDVKAKKKNADPAKCNHWGCSVWTDEKAVYHALELFDFLGKKFIVVGEITSADGAIKNTGSNSQPEHYTFWKACGRQIAANFSIFMQDGARP